jgi:hypothetical protein
MFVKHKPVDHRSLDLAFRCTMLVTRPSLNRLSSTIIKFHQMHVVSEIRAELTMFADLFKSKLICLT